MRAELQREDLRVYSAVVMADRDLVAGDVAGALARLQSEADKLRCHDTPINDLIKGLEGSCRDP